MTRMISIYLLLAFTETGNIVSPNDSKKFYFQEKFAIMFKNDVHTNQHWKILIKHKI